MEPRTCAKAGAAKSEKALFQRSEPISVCPNGRFLEQSDWSSDGSGDPPLSIQRQKSLKVAELLPFGTCSLREQATGRELNSLHFIKTMSIKNVCKNKGHALFTKSFFDDKSVIQNYFSNVM